MVGGVAWGCVVIWGLRGFLMGILSVVVSVAKMRYGLAMMRRLDAHAVCCNHNGPVALWGATAIQNRTTDPPGSKSTAFHLPSAERRIPPENVSPLNNSLFRGLHPSGR